MMITHEEIAKRMGRAFAHAGVRVGPEAIQAVTSELFDLGLFSACKEGCKEACKTGCKDGGHQ